MPISFQNADVKFKVPQPAALKRFITTQVKITAHKQLQLSYIFCSDDFLLNINRQFLNHDYYTDIITFPLSETDMLIEAEIYISTDRVTDNARKLKTPFQAELHRVIFHGVLHLLGYKDKTRLQKAAMRKAEDKWLKEYLSLPIKKGSR